MKKIILLVSCVCLLSSCSIGINPSRLLRMSNNSQTTNIAEGASFEKAVYIDETDEKESVAKEYSWLQNHYPDCKIIKQKVTYNNNIPYDVINIRTSNGEELLVYFNIIKSARKKI